MALERVPADIRAQGGVARMSDPKMIRDIMDTVTIPVMAKARIGHFVECQVRRGDTPYLAPLPTPFPSLHTPRFIHGDSFNQHEQPLVRGPNRSSKPWA